MKNYILNLLTRAYNSMKLRADRRRFRKACSSLGAFLVVRGPIYLTIFGSGSLKIGNNFTILSGMGLNPISRNICSQIAVENAARLSIGNNCGFSSVCIWSHESITIGNHVSIGADSIIMDSDAHSLNYLNRRNLDTDMSSKNTAPIWIGSDVLIGARCVILKGVTIGDRAVVGAGSIVTKNVPADSIVAGNPARVLKNLNDIR